MNIQKADVLSSVKSKQRLLELAKKTPQDDIKSKANTRLRRPQIEAMFIEAQAVTVDHLLSLLQLDELKKLCRSLHRSDKGRQKGELIYRILGRNLLIAEDSGTAKANRKASGAIKDELTTLMIHAAHCFAKKHQAFAVQLLAAYGSDGPLLEDIKFKTTLKYESKGQRVQKKVLLHWPDRRVLMDIVDASVDLQDLWKDDYLDCLLAMRRPPEYVVLSNLRQVHLYGFAGDREKPQLAFSLSDWPKHSDSFSFLKPEWTPGDANPIQDEDKVTKEISRLVGNLYQSLVAKHCPEGDHKDDPMRKKVTRFVLQCVTAMFSEDVGLLPEKAFTNLLYAGASDRSVEARLKELFGWMATPVHQRGHSEIPYFNGGLFIKPVVLDLDAEQLEALTRAAEAQWSKVKPEIFGSLFESVMNPEKRRATGAHYTSVEDIMKVVGPTVVEPWRQRLERAKTQEVLEQVREELHQFRVLDPACGSGNFLYVAYFELYNLETELLLKMFAMAKNEGERRKLVQGVDWNCGIPITNLFGIEINDFAVELSKTTLNMAKNWSSMSVARKWRSSQNSWA